MARSLLIRVRWRQSLNLLLVRTRLLLILLGLGLNCELGEIKTFMLFIARVHRS